MKRLLIKLGTGVLSRSGGRKPGQIAAALAGKDVRTRFPVPSKMKR